jgi:hypothetical protein
MDSVEWVEAENAPIPMLPDERPFVAAEDVFRAAGVDSSLWGRIELTANGMSGNRVFVEFGPLRVEALEIAVDMLRCGWVLSSFCIVDRDAARLPGTRLEWFGPDGERLNGNCCGALAS